MKFYWLAFAALAGCALGPDYKPVPAPQGAAAPFISTNAQTSAAAPPDAWWRLYNDPQLDQLIRQSFAANTDLAAAEANLAASRAVLEGARSVLLLPQTSTATGYTYGRSPTTNEILELTGNKPQTGWSDDAILDASYELDLFGHIRRSIEESRDSAEATLAARDDLRVTIAAEVARAYGQICTLGEQLRVAQQSVNLATQQANIVQQQFAAGGGSQFDVVRAQVVVAQSQATLPPLQGARKAALFELAYLLGQTPQNAPTQVESCVTPPRLAETMPVGDGAALLKRRPDIREADRKYAAALAAQGVATADLFPRITLTGFYGGASNEPRNLFSNNGLIWGVGPAISWSFPNLALPLSQLAQSKASVKAALAAYHSTILQALNDTEAALATYTAELNHHAALVQAQTEAQHEYSLAQDSFAAGQISNLDVLTSEQTVISANAAVASSDAALVQDQIAVFKQLGGGWQ